LCNADVTSKCGRYYEHVVLYWHNVKEALQEPLTPSFSLKDNFWLTTYIQVTLANQLAEDSEDCEEFGEDETYVGPLQGRLSRAVVISSKVSSS